jgi:hypothetical protein
MGSPLPRPLIAQAIIFIIAVVVFTGVLTIFGSVPTSNIPERPINAGNATATPSPWPDDGLAVTVTTVPGADDSITRTATPAPVVNDMISQPDMDVQSLPVNLSGSGPQNTGSFRLEPGTIAFDISSDSPGNIEVWLMYDGERYDLLLENGLIAEGPLLEQLVTGGNYFLDVTADGKWQINVSQAGSA